MLQNGSKCYNSLDTDFNIYYYLQCAVLLVVSLVAFIQSLDSFIQPILTKYHREL